MTTERKFSVAVAMSNSDCHMTMSYCQLEVKGHQERVHITVTIK